MALGFIKKIFRKENDIYLTSEELLPWLKSRHEKIMTELETILAENKKEFDEVIVSSKEKIKNLRDAQLRNSSIPKEEIEVMESSRIQYMAMIVRFIKSLNMPGNPKAIPKFHDDFQKALDELSDESYKPYNTLKMFVSDKVDDVVDVIKSLDRLEKTIHKAYSQSGIDTIEEMIERLSVEKKQLPADDEGKLKKELDAVDANITRLKKELDEANSKNKDANVPAQLSSGDENSMADAIATFNAAANDIKYSFRRFSSMTRKHTEWIDAYIDDPADTLRTDTHLAIADIIESMTPEFEKMKIPDVRLPKLKKNISALDKETLKLAHEGLVMGLIGGKKPAELSKPAIDTGKIEADIKKAEEKRASLLKKLQDITSEVETEIDQDIIERINEDLHVNLRIVSKETAEQ